MAKKVMQKKEMKGKEDDSKLFAFLATFFGIIGFVIALVAKKDNKYVMHYAKQSLVIFIFMICAWIVGGILSAVLAITIVGIVLIPVVMGIIWLVVVILWLISWIYALSGEEKEVPVIGKYGRKFNF